jgi:CRP/FNR family transcriptional regulator, cyclic AMP receptor protein
MEWALLAGLSEDDQRRFVERTRRRRFRKHEIVFHEADGGDSLHLIRSGRFAVRASTPRGDVATLALLGPGEFFGEGALLSTRAVRTASVIALEPAETLAMHRSAFEELRQLGPAPDRVLIAVLAARIERLSEHLIEALFVPTEQRVWRRLLAVMALYPSAGALVVIPLTQEDLAGLAGTTRPTVNQILRAAEETGALRLDRGRITIVDAGELKRRAK